VPEDTGSGPASGPRRWKRSRRPGSHYPSDAVYVGRPSIYGNPFTLRDWPREVAVALYEEALLAGELPLTLDIVKKNLRGKDLVCWCDLDESCHADVLLLLANP
jgi:Domain of unknown function (DUF4326)